MLTDSPIADLLTKPAFRQRKGASCRHGARSGEGIIKKEFVMVTNLSMRKTCLPCICVRPHARLEGRSADGTARTAAAAVYSRHMCLAIVRDIVRSSISRAAETSLHNRLCGAALAASMAEQQPSHIHVFQVTAGSHRAIYNRQKVMRVIPNWIPPQET